MNEPPIRPFSLRAPEGYTPSAQQLHEARRLMFVTRDLAKKMGVPIWQQQLTLEDGTHLLARVSGRFDFVAITPVPPEKVEREEQQEEFAESRVVFTLWGNFLPWVDGSQTAQQLTEEAPLPEETYSSTTVGSVTTVEITNQPLVSYPQRVVRTPYQQMLFFSTAATRLESTGTDINNSTSLYDLFETAEYKAFVVSVGAGGDFQTALDSVATTTRTSYEARSTRPSGDESRFTASHREVRTYDGMYPVAAGISLSSSIVVATGATLLTRMRATGYTSWERELDSDSGDFYSDSDSAVEYLRDVALGVVSGGSVVEQVDLSSAGVSGVAYEHSSSASSTTFPSPIQTGHGSFVIYALQRYLSSHCILAPRQPCRSASDWLCMVGDETPYAYYVRHNPLSTPSVFGLSVIATQTNPMRYITASLGAFQSVATEQGFFFCIGLRYSDSLPLDAVGEGVVFLPKRSIPDAQTGIFSLSDAIFIPTGHLDDSDSTAWSRLCVATLGTKEAPGVPSTLLVNAARRQYINLDTLLGAIEAGESLEGLGIRAYEPTGVRGTAYVKAPFPETSAVLWDPQVFSFGVVDDPVGVLIPDEPPAE